LNFSGNGRNSRSSQLFISLQQDGGSFGRELWETPIGEVVQGIEHVKNFYSEYGDMPPWGNGPEQQKIHNHGNKYMEDNFPKMSKFFTCDVDRKGGPNAQNERAASDTGDEDEPRHVRADGHHWQHHPHEVNNNNNAHLKDAKDKVRSHRSHVQHPPQQQQHHHHSANYEEHVAGNLHHQHSVHFNAAPDEEGLTKLSWELLGTCLILFLGVLMLWLRCALSSTKPKRRKSS
jgi:hypothetical protein